MSKFEYPQDPRTSHSPAKGHANGLGQKNQLGHWLAIVKVLTNYLDVLRANHVGDQLLWTNSIDWQKALNALDYLVEFAGSINFGAQAIHTDIFAD